MESTPSAAPTVIHHKIENHEIPPPPRWDASRSTKIGSKSMPSLKPGRLSEVMLEDARRESQREEARAAGGSRHVLRGGAREVRVLCAVCAAPRAWRVGTASRGRRVAGVVAPVSPGKVLFFFPIYTGKY